MQLRLDHQQAGELLRLASSNAPNEVCGLLGGLRGRVGRVVTIDNVAKDPRRRFEMDPRQLVQTLFAFEREGLELCAIWHSHPDGMARPSPADVQEAAWPDACHLIVGLANGRARLGAWHIADARVKRVPLQIGGAAPDIAPEEEGPEPRMAIWVSAVTAILVAIGLALSLLPPAPGIP